MASRGHNESKFNACFMVLLQQILNTVYPKKYAHGFVVLCFVVVMQSFIMNSHEVFIHIHQGCFAGTGAIVRLPQCQWSKPDGYGKISQCITTTKHSKAKTVCIFLGIYCSSPQIFRHRGWNDKITLFLFLLKQAFSEKGWRSSSFYIVIILGISGIRYHSLVL